MNNTEYATIAGILVLIASMTYVGVTYEQPTHYCLSTMIKSHCYSLSGTNVTCYTLPTKQSYKRCSEGWQEIPEFRVKPVTAWRCDNIKCIALD